MDESLSEKAKAGWATVTHRALGKVRPRHYSALFNEESSILV